MTASGPAFMLLVGTEFSVLDKGDFRTAIVVETGAHALTSCWAPTHMLN
jgi:hypothetical protein